MQSTIPKTQSTWQWLWQHRFAFVGLITVCSGVIYLLAYGVGVLPQSLTFQPQPNHSQSPTPAAANVADLDDVPKQPTQAQPTRVEAPAVGIDAQVLNPTSQQPSVLNSYLAKGAVRYPGSGYPGNGNLFIFGHSTSQRTVINSAYKTFNQLEDLQSGDTITVHTQQGAFTYSVQSVRFKKDSAAYVPFDTNKNLLTIATCDSFGQKEDRVIVRAEFTRFIPERSSNT